MFVCARTRACLDQLHHNQRCNCERSSKAAPTGKSFLWLTDGRVQGSYSSVFTRSCILHFRGQRMKLYNCELCNYQLNELHFNIQGNTSWMLVKLLLVFVTVVPRQELWYLLPHGTVDCTSISTRRSESCLTVLDQWWASAGILTLKALLFSTITILHFCYFWSMVLIWQK